jgi:hypothetical protein
MHSRRICDVDTTNDRFSIAQHGLALDQVVELVEDPGGTLPSPLAKATAYYAIPVASSESLLQLAASAGGAAIDLTTAGTGTFGLFVPIASTISASLEYVSRKIDRYLIAHEVQLTAPYPVEIVGICAKLAARELLSRLGRSSDAVSEAAELAARELPHFARGVSLRDSTATASANESEAWGEDDRSWTLADGAII